MFTFMFLCINLYGTVSVRRPNLQLYIIYLFGGNAWFIGGVTAKGYVVLMKNSVFLAQCRFWSVGIFGFYRLSNCFDIYFRHKIGWWPKSQKIYNAEFLRRMWIINNIFTKTSFTIERWVRLSWLLHNDTNYMRGSGPLAPPPENWKFIKFT